MKRILTSLVLVASVYSFAQVSVSGENNHTPKATLDVEAIDNKTTPDGILIPRVTTKMAQDMPQPETSTLVYIKEENIKTGGGTRTVDVDVAGFYYFNGTKWVKLGGESATQNWRDIRITPEVTGKKGGLHRVTKDGEAIPATAFLVTTDLNGNTSLLLPDATSFEAGKMIVISKTGTGVLAVLDKDGLTGNAPSSQLLSNGSLYPYTGKIFITDGSGWYSLNQ